MVKRVTWWSMILVLEFKYIFLARICAPIGRVIELDLATIRKSRPSVAKVRLEIDVTKPRLERIWIEVVNREGVVSGFWQRIEFLKVPIYCEDCSRFGHGRLTCRRVRIGVDRRGDDLGGANPVSGTMEEMNALGENVGEVGDEGTGVETVEGENETLNNKCMPTVCGNAPVTETETEIVEEAVSKVKEGEKVQEKGNFSTPCANMQQMVIKARESEQCVKPKGKENGDMATGKFLTQFTKAMTALIQDSIEKKERKRKEGGAKSSVSTQARVKDVSEGSAKGERVFKNTMDWVKVVEEFMKKDKVLDQKVKEALKEVNTYLWTVYDKEKEEYIEEGINRAMRAAAIFLVKLEQGFAIGPCHWICKRNGRQWGSRAASKSRISTLLGSGAEPGFVVTRTASSSSAPKSSRGSFRSVVLSTLRLALIFFDPFSLCGKLAKLILVVQIHVKLVHRYLDTFNQQDFLGLATFTCTTLSNVTGNTLVTNNAVDFAAKPVSLKDDESGVLVVEDESGVQPIGVREVSPPPPPLAGVVELLPYGPHAIDV
nr:TMV resistance protein N-like [Ipomoea batatas]